MPLCNGEISQARSPGPTPRKSLSNVATWSPDQLYTCSAGAYGSGTNTCVSSQLSHPGWQPRATVRVSPPAINRHYSILGFLPRVQIKLLTWFQFSFGGGDGLVSHCLELILPNKKICHTSPIYIFRFNHRCNETRQLFLL